MNSSRTSSEKAALETHLSLEEIRRAFFRKKKRRLDEISKQNLKLECLKKMDPKKQEIRKIEQEIVSLSMRVSNYDTQINEIEIIIFSLNKK